MNGETITGCKDVQPLCLLTVKKKSKGTHAGQCDMAINPRIFSLIVMTQIIWYCLPAAKSNPQNAQEVSFSEN